MGPGRPPEPPFAEGCDEKGPWAAKDRLAEFRELVRAPVLLLERFLQEAEAAAREASASTPAGKARLGALRQAAEGELAETLHRFRRRLRELEPGLLALRHPPRPDLHQAIREASLRLERLIAQAAQREELLTQWERMPPEDIVGAYCEALQEGPPHVVESYEAEAETVLRQKGNAEALQGFLELRTLAGARRLTAVQRQAQADLEELEGLSRRMRLSGRVVGLILKLSSEVMVPGAGRRHEGRVGVEETIRERIFVLVLPGATPGMTAGLVDVSRTGLQLDVPAPADVGTVLNLIVKSPAFPQGGVRLQGEVRWCGPEGTRYRAGLRIAPRVREQWVTFLAWVAGGVPAAKDKGGER